MNTLICIRNKLAKAVVYLLLQSTQPVSLGKTEHNTSFCSIVSHNHLFLYITAVKSFVYWSQLALPALIVDDGTLTTKDRAMLKHHLRHCLIVTKKIADKKIKRLLRSYPHCLAYRVDTHPSIETHNQKLFDPLLFCPTKYFILLDSDVLFYSRPTAMINWIKGDKKHIAYMQYASSYLQTCNTWGMLTMRVFARLVGNPGAIKLNSGLICGARSLFSLAKVERLCAAYSAYALNHTWLGDQPIFAQLFLSEKTSLTQNSGLPSDAYCVFTHSAMRKNLWQKVCIHYHTGAHKFVCFVDSVRLLINTRLFTKPQSD